MFCSLKREIVFPQSEHSRLAGILAHLWGNTNFDKPSLDFNSFVKGVSFHDRGYGFLDHLPVRERSEQAWLETQRKGIEIEYQDKTADILIRLQLARLLEYSETPERKKRARTLRQQIENLCNQNSFSLEDFLWADRITNFCDNLAFDFCFEKETTGSVSVFPKKNSEKQTSIEYELNSSGQISISPWPFSVESHKGFLTAEDNLKGLIILKTLEPVIVPFSLNPIVLFTRFVAILERT